MATIEKAREHFKTHRYDFSVEEMNGGVEPFEVFCTTEAAQRLDAILQDTSWNVVAIHPEFAGWDMEEIAKNLEE